MSRERPPPAKWARALVRARLLSVVVVVALTAVSALFATELGFNFSPDNLFSSKDPVLDFYMHRQVPAFGAGDNTCVIALEGELRSPSVQRALVELHQRFEREPGIEDVRSLANALLPDQGSFGFSPLFDAEGNVSAERLARAAEDPLLAGMLVDEELGAAALYVRVAREWGSEASREAAVARVLALVRDVDERYPELSLMAAGVPIAQDAIVKTLKRDQLIFVPLVVAIMCVLLWATFRDLRGVILPFLATGTATLWVLGYLVVIGHEINVVNNAIVVLVLVIGIADAVHVVARFEDELLLARMSGKVDKEEVLARVVEAMLVPCFLTTATTAIGFASSIVADMAIIRDFGIDAAVGVLGAFVTTMLLVPALLAFLPLPEPHPMRPLGRRDLLVGALERLARFSLARARLVVAVSALLFGGGIWLATKVGSNQKLVSELPDDDPSVVATRFLEERFAGVMPFDVVFVAEERARLFDPDVVRATAELDAFISSAALGPTARSYADLLAAVDRALQGEKATPVERWSDEKVRQLQLLFELSPPDVQERALEGIVATRAPMARIMALTPDVGTEVFAPFRDALMERAAAISLDGVEVHVSGGTVVATRGLERVVRDLSSSLLLAVVCILAFITLLFRSPRYGLVALFPNLLPIVGALAAMTLFDVELRVATVIIFSMSLGVAVDSCIHLLARLQEELRWHERDEAIVKTLRGAGRPVVYSVGLLLLGFVVMGLSRFQALRDFSLLSFLTLGAALVVDLVLLPALLRVFGSGARR